MQQSIVIKALVWCGEIIFGVTQVVAIFMSHSGNYEEELLRQLHWL